MEIFFAIVQLLFAGALLYFAATGKNRMFYSTRVRKGKEQQYKLTGRIGFLVLGILMLAMSVVNGISLLNPENAALVEQLAEANMYLSFGVLTVLLVLWRRFRSLQDQNKRNAPVRPATPRAAFVFDEEENEQPSKKK